MDKWFKDILPDKDPYHNRGGDQMRKKGVRNSSASVWLYPLQTTSIVSVVMYTNLYNNDVIIYKLKKNCENSFACERVYLIFLIKHWSNSLARS